MDIFIASDHGGYSLKEEIEKLRMPDFNFIDVGPISLDPEDDYPIFAENLINTMLKDKKSLGILICRSGIGMSIIANKFKGIYAALCFTPEHARKAKEHNNANILCLDSDYGEFENHIQIIKSFLNSSFEGSDSRHGRRVNQIVQIEKQNFK